MFQLLMFRIKQRKDKAMRENESPFLILASGSATRAKLLQAAGVKFQIDISNLDEDVIKREGADLVPEDLAILLARRKAQHVAPRHPGKFVLGADQILVCDGQRFDKPPDIETLRQQLLSLRGRAHVLISALSIERAKGRKSGPVVKRPIFRCVRSAMISWSPILSKRTRTGPFGRLAAIVWKAWGRTAV